MVFSRGVNPYREVVVLRGLGVWFLGCVWQTHPSKADITPTP